MKLSNIIVVIALLFSIQAVADEVQVKDAWSRATAPGQEVGMVGMVITSQKDARLIAVSSPVSASTEIHSMTMDNGVMKMRQLENLALPAKEAVTLGMEGNHLMLIDLKHALKAGEEIPLTLTVQFGDKSKKKVKVIAITKPLVEEHNHHHHH